MVRSSPSPARVANFTNTRPLSYSPQITSAASEAASTTLANVLLPRASAITTISVSNRPPQRVGGTIGRPGAPPTSNTKKPAGITMNPSSTRCRLAECERRTTHAQNRMKVAKQVQGRHNWSEG